MADGISLKIEGSEAVSILNEALGRLSNPRPLLNRIGEDVLFITKQRFLSEEAPDGSPWERLKNPRRRQGGGSGGDKILQDTRALFQSLQYSVNNDNVQVGTNLNYAPFHQFGTSRGIPERPFLGTDSETERNVIDITLEYLNEVFN